MTFCIIATRDFLPSALVLLDALREFHPRARLLLLYVGREPSDRSIPVLDEVNVIWTRELVDADSEAAMRRRYSIPEMCFALKPRLLRFALDRFGDRAVYLDADIDVLGPLREAVAALERASVVLTPHLDAPIPMDGKLPSDMTILRAGACNLGFIGVAEGNETRRLLDWWDERVVRWGFVVPEAGYHGDQKWMDLAPSLFPGTALLRDPGSNVSYWNLHSRKLVRDAAGGITVNGAPLAFVHFSGFDPDDPDVISRQENRIDSRSHPELMHLAREYAARIVAARGRAAALAWQGMTDNEPVAGGSATLATSAMEDPAYRARIVPAYRGGIVAAGEEAIIAVTVTNASGEEWPVGRTAQGGAGIALTWHLRDSAGVMLAYENRRYFLPRDLRPGESLQMTVGIRVPFRPGSYIVEFDLVHEGFAWFSDRGSPTAPLELLVDAFSTHVSIVND